MRKTYKDFVCPNCFYTLDKCKCDINPYHLIQIDSKIQEHIRILKRKGYITIGSCEGHKEICNYIYISFNKDYGFGTIIPLPNEFSFYKKKYMMSYELKRNLSDDEMENIKDKKLKELLEWCKSLPNSNTLHNN